MQNPGTHITKRDRFRATIKPDSDITANTTADLRSEIKLLVADGIRELDIDLANVGIVDSSGIGLLVATHNALDRLSGKLTVVNASLDLCELFKAFRLEKHFTIQSIYEAGSG